SSGTAAMGRERTQPGAACTLRRANIASLDRRVSPAPAQRPRSCEGVAPVGDSGSTRPMRGAANRAVAVVVGAALVAAMAAVPQDALALQDSIQAAAQRGAGEAGAASAGSTPVQRADSAASSLLDADGDGDGVPDFMDRCLGTAPGTAVGRDGCAARARRGLLP